ncbi:MAG: hypothetical protein WAT47_07405, partial [Nostocoides sp.]
IERFKEALGGLGRRRSSPVAARHTGGASGAGEDDDQGAGEPVVDLAGIREAARAPMTPIEDRSLR